MWTVLWSVQNSGTNIFGNNDVATGRYNGAAATLRPVLNAVDDGWMPSEAAEMHLPRPTTSSSR